MGLSGSVIFHKQARGVRGLLPGENVAILSLRLSRKTISCVRVQLYAQ